MKALKVKKRDGRYVKFNIKKIDNAILAAVKANNFKLTKNDIKKYQQVLYKQLKKKKLKK